jgi:hypothetical protein
MPFKSRAQMRAMFAKGGKSAETARRWAHKYGTPKRKRRRRRR